MDIKEAAHSDAAEQRSADTAATVRRRVLAAGLGGAALSLLPWFGSRASARPATVPPGDSTEDPSFGDETSDSTAGGTPDSAVGVAEPSASGPEDTSGDTSGSAVPVVAPAPTTTAPPKRPTPEDVELLGFAQTVELSTVALYDTALEAGVFEDPVVAANFTTIRQAHLAYAQSISGLLGRESPNVKNEALYLELRGDFTGAPEAVFTACAGLENTLVATHTDLVGELVGTDGSALVASFLVIEARHATVFQTFAGGSAVEDIITAEAEALSPDDYPVE